MLLHVVICCVEITTFRYIYLQINQCDPNFAIGTNWALYDGGILPCDGGIQFQHLHYTPKNEDDGKELSCSLDGDYDGNADYSPSSIRLLVNQKYVQPSVVAGWPSVEELILEFRDVWGDAHVKSGKD